NIGQLLILARAAEQVVPILEANPTLIPQVRAYVQDTNNITTALGNISPTWQTGITYRQLLEGSPSSFADLLGRGSFHLTLDDLPPFTPDPENAGPEAGSLFSYDALRALSAYYLPEGGAVTALSAILDSAERAEASGNDDAKAAQLKAFRTKLK